MEVVCDKSILMLDVGQLLIIALYVQQFTLYMFILYMVLVLCLPVNRMNQQLVWTQELDGMCGTTSFES